MIPLYSLLPLVPPGLACMDLCTIPPYTAPDALTSTNPPIKNIRVVIATRLGPLGKPDCKWDNGMGLNGAALLNLYLAEVMETPAERHDR